MEPKGGPSQAPDTCPLGPPPTGPTGPHISLAAGLRLVLCLYPAAFSGEISPLECTRSPCFIIQEVCKLLLSLLSHIYIFKSQLIGKLQ